MLQFDNVNNVKAFKAKTEDEVIKVKDCTFANDITDEKRKYYFCPCSSKDCSPICEACASTCHKHHEPSVSVEGIYECKCGVHNHVISQNLEKYYNEVKRELKRKCFYYEFFRFTLNLGFYHDPKENQVICCICRDFCMSDNKDLVPLKKSKKTQVCECEKHYEENLLNINQDLLKHELDFKKYIMNFNFNLINTVPNSQKVYFQFLKEKLEGYEKKAAVSEEELKIEANRFFKDFFLFNLLILFDELTFKYKNKFYSLGNFFGVEKETLIKLINQPLGNISENDAKDLMKTKTLFGKMIYYTFSRSFILKYNNLFEHTSIINMNVFQRELYLIEAKSFFKHSVKSNEEENEKKYIESLDDLPISLLEIYETVLKINENVDIFEEISQVIFRVFNRTFKHLIKYNMIADEHINKYFELVLDTISIYNDKGTENFSGNSYFIIKSIFYALLYKNDKICLTRFREGSFANEKAKQFSFVANEDTSTISKIFLFIMNRYGRKHPAEKLLKYDFFIQKIFELMIGNGEYYKYSLENLLTLSQEDLDASFYPYKIYNSLNRKLFDEIRKISISIQEINTEFDEFKIELPQFVEKINKSLESLKELVTSHLSDNIPNLKKLHEVYPEMNNKEMTKIKEIQNCVKYTNLVTQINKALNIYSESRKFFKLTNLDMSTFSYLDKKVLHFLLLFFFIIIDQNYENLVLFMNFHPEELYNTFIEVNETLLDYYLILSEMLFGLSLQIYKFDNYIFFCHTISYFAQRLEFDMSRQKEFYHNLQILSKLLRIYRNPIKYFNMNKGEIIDTVDFLLNKINVLISNKNFINELTTYIKTRNEAEVKLSKNKRSNSDIIEKLLKNYFQFANELIYHDLYFFGIFRDENFLLPFDLIEDIVQDPDKFNLPVLVEIEICRFYQLISFRNSFVMKNTYQVVENYFKLDIFKNTDLKHIVTFDIKGERDKIRKAPVDDQKNPKYEWTQYKIINCSSMMIQTLKRFERNMKRLQLSFKSHFNKRLKIFQYFENCIVRPFYLILHLFMKEKNLINGDISYNFYEMSFYFLKSTVYFYENVNSSSNILDEEEAKIMRKISLFDFKEILIKQDLEGSFLSEITEDIILIKDEFIKYFQINCLYEICRLNIKKILKNGEILKGEENIDDDFPRERSMAKSEAVNLLTQKEGNFGFLLDYGGKLFKKNEGEQKSKETEKIEKVIAKYEKSNEKYNNDDRALIKVLDLTDSDYDIDLRKYIFDYIHNKLSDSLTHFNDKDNPDFVYDKFNDINIDSFKFQNSYCLYFINLLFTHDTDGFQESLSEQHEDKDFLTSEVNFLKFIIYYFIFANSINEVSRLEQLDYSVPKESLGYKMCTISIKFIQNLCEGHNITFQNLFFELSVFSKNPKDNIGSPIVSTNRKNNHEKIPSLSVKEDDEAQEKKSMNSEKNEEGGESSEEEEEEKEQNNIENKEKIEADIKLLEDKKVFSFLNFVSGNMRIILRNQKNDLLKDYTQIQEIYQRYTDLIIEMIQGTEKENLKNFYRKVKDYEALTNDGKINEKKLIFFQFLMLINEVRNSMLDEELLLDKLSLKIRLNLFAIINNLINGSNIDQELIKFFVFVFEPDRLIDLISKYLRSLYIKHIKEIDYDDLNFKESYVDLELNKETYDELYQTFKTNTDFYEDEFFKISSLLYLFLTILGERYGINEAQKVLTLYKKELQVVKMEEDILNLRSSGFFNRIKEWIKEKLLGYSTEEANKQIEEKFKKKQKFNVNNLIISSKFYNKIIRSCEFVIGEEQTLKKLYFVIDPKVYLISKRNIDSFFDEVDRSSSTTKLKGFLDQLNLFCTEVEYKEKHLKSSTYLKRMLEIEYSNADLMNFFFALFINIILLMFLDNNSFNEGMIFHFIMIIALVQIALNLIYLVIFLISKYDFYVSLERSKILEKKLSILQQINIRLDSFLFNEEIFFIILNTVIGIIGVFNIQYTFLFTLQLLTIIKFVDTIKEIVIAFKIRIGQLLSMIGFLIILIYFYSNIGFYYFADEFKMTMDNGAEENICGSLIQCAITYFNNGVRSGGGIGDLLSMKPFSDLTIYTARYVMDMIFYITIVLLLLNMINGVIVSTFSQIREESNNKEEDRTNKCFICSIDRVEFEKKKIAFKDHLKYEHNSKTYIKFLVFLKMIDYKDLDADQSHIIESINERDIGCFPVLKSISIGDLEDEGEGSDED